MSKAKILLLEDDANLNETITEFLEDNNYIVESLYDGIEAQERLYENKFDLLLLDVNTPSMSGFELLKWAREEGHDEPAIFITSLNSIEDFEQGYKSGCDDYIRKPFALKEVLIRIETLLKRSFFHDKQEFININENTKYNITQNELLIDKKIIILGKKESILLKIFMKHHNEVISHEYIYNHLWTFDEQPSDTSLRTYIKNIRKLVGKDKIISIKKQGYKFVLIRELF